MSLTASLANSADGVQAPKSLALPLISVSSDNNLITSGQISHWSNKEVIEWISNVQQGLFAQYSSKLQSLNINGEELLNLSMPFMMNELEMKNANHRLTLEAQINRLKNKGYKRKSIKHRSILTSLPMHSHSKSLGPMIIHPIVNDTHQLTHSISHTIRKHSRNRNKSENKKNKKKKKKKKSKKSNKNKKLKTVPIGSKFQHSLALESSSLSMDFKSDSNINNNTSEMLAIQNLEQSNTSPDSFKEEWMSIPDMNLKIKKKPNKYYYKELAKQLWPRETAVIVKEGWLRKKGERGGRKFKQRWCELRKNGRFYYFEKRPSVKNSPQGFIDVKHDVLSIEFIEEQDIYTSGFALKTVARVWIFTCISDESLISWMTSIKSLIANNQ